MTDNSELLKRAKMGDEKAADKLVENNIGLVHSIAGRFAGRRCEKEDLFQIGAIGLIKAVKRFDTSYGVQFSTYAVPMIIGEIKRFLRDDGAVKVSRAIKETAAKGRRAEEVLSERLGRCPTLSEIAYESGISPEELAAAFDAAREPESLENGSDGRALIDLLARDDTEDRIVDRVFLQNALAALDKREREILVLRYFKGKTQSEIAKIIGVSQVQISRLEKKAMRRIREAAL